MQVDMTTLEITSGPHMVSELKLLKKGRNPDGMNFMSRLKICSRFGDITIYMVNLTGANLLHLDVGE